ncbi:MAG: asparagine synthase (glutamine-hydrolyzing) [Pirellulaceae bacterium]
MCGITGAIWTDPDKAIDATTLTRMTDVLRHRGPDDSGQFRNEWRTREPYEAQPGVALGFRRLSIIDLSGGHQPMANETDDVWVVFNGEIYNYPALRNRLEGAGHRFRTHSDTETLVHLYEDEQLDMFHHLNGMFAFAVWDGPRRRLVLARDRIGQKPLFYRAEAGRVLFASELKSLLQVPDVPREIDPGAVDEYLTYQYVPHPHCILQGIHKLPPGHFAVFQDGNVEVRPYWQPDFAHEIAIDEREAVHRVRELLESSVTMRMRSDVPLGAFLSGGIDSSLLTAIMQKHSEQPIKTFSIGFPEAEFDETAYARQVAEHLGCDHERFEVTPDGVEILPKLIWHYDEPFADSSAVPTWYVSQLTRRHVTVALSGDGGDELFGGYDRYKAVRVATRLDRVPSVRNFFAASVWSRLPDSTAQRSLLRKIKRFSEAVRQPPERRYLRWLVIFDEARRAEIYNDDFLTELPDRDPASFVQNAWRRAGRRDPVTCASLADVTTYLPCDLMTKVDIASMAHSLEVRQPFLDYRLVEFAASLPVRLKLRWGRGKWLLRSAFGSMLPAEIWNRRKMGFGVPIAKWFRNELKEMVHDTLLADDAKCRRFFREDVLHRTVREHTDGTFNHGYRLWCLLMLELWMRQWTAAPVAASSSSSVSHS